MKFIRIIALLMSCWFLCGTTAQATHIVGGELTYRCIGQDVNGVNRFEISLVIYRDCFNGNPQAYFDDPASIGIFGSDNQLVTELGIGGQLLIDFTTSDDTLDPVLANPCLVVPPNVCVHTTSYLDTLDLPFRAGGYLLAYQRCCRNRTILNIERPLESGATYSVEISEQALRECNSSATFNNWPPIYICANEPIDFDQSATDLDGDSIVYRLCTPQLGANQALPIPQPPNNPPYDTVVWVDPPYSLMNMLNGSPGEPLRIDPNTGLLSGVPNTVGQFVVGICLEEYRDGQLISTTRRDFQYNVGLCGQTVSSFFIPEIQCDGFTVDFENLSSNASDFEWYFNDPNQPGAISNDQNPSFTFSDTGRYTIMLIAAPGKPCVDTSYQEIYIQYQSLFPKFTYDQINCTDSLTIQVTDLSFDTISTITSWNWSLTYVASGDTIATSTLQNPQFSILASGNVRLDLRVDAQNGCVRDTTVFFPVDLLDNTGLVDLITICPGDSAFLNPDANLMNLYEWEPHPDILDVLNPNPQVSPDDDTFYVVMVTNDDGCSRTDSVFVFVEDNPPPLAVNPVIDTIALGQSIQLDATRDPTYTYQWQPPGTLNDPNIPNPVATPEETTVYTLTIQNNSGCSNRVSLRVVVIDPECAEPFLFLPNAFSPNGDGRNEEFRLLGNYVEEMYLAIYDRWGRKVFETSDQSIGWDGTYQGKPVPTDSYGYYLRVRCIGEKDHFKKGNVTLLR